MRQTQFPDFACYGFDCPKNGGFGAEKWVIRVCYRFDCKCCRQSVLTIRASPTHRKQNMIHDLYTPVQFENAKRTALWVIQDRFAHGGGQCTVLVTREQGDLFSVVTFSDTQVVSERFGLSYKDALAAVAEQMKEEYSF